MMLKNLEQTYLYKEIHEQPAVLLQLLEHERENLQYLAEAIRGRDISHIVIAARGTSDNAAIYAKYLLASVNRLVAGLATPSLFTIYQKPPKFGNALVLGISQSGKSPDIVSVLSEARQQGALTATITNSPDSELGKTADFVIDLHAGPEHSVAATKTYTSELAAIALLSAVLDDNDGMIDALHQIPEAVANTLKMGSVIAEIAQRYRYMRFCVVIGRGYNYATAFEMALKMEELTYTVVEPYSSADFLHGPLAMIERGFPVVVIAPNGVMIPEMIDLIRTLKQKKAEVIAISDHSELLALPRIPLALPSTVPEWLSPITAIIPGQMFAMYLAHVRDYDVDKPRSLHKVTETV